MADKTSPCLNAAPTSSTWRCTEPFPAPVHCPLCDLTILLHARSLLCKASPPWDVAGDSPELSTGTKTRSGSTHANSEHLFTFLPPSRSCILLMYNTALFTWEHVKDIGTFCKVALDASFAQEVEKSHLSICNLTFLTPTAAGPSRMHLPESPDTKNTRDMHQSARMVYTQ